jgi:hypothetical protein
MRSASRTGKRSLVRTVIAVAGAVSVWLVLVPPAEASWTPVNTVSAAGWQGIDAPAVAADRHGDFLLAWAACYSSTTCPQRAQARIKPPGSPMGPVVTLSPSPPQAFGVEAAADDAGDSAVVWYNLDRQVAGRRISATGSLGRLQTLSPAGAITQNPQVVSTPSGDALVVWPQFYNGGTYSLVARYFRKDGSLGPLMTLGPASGDRAAVAVDRLGGAVVAWDTLDSDYGLLARRITPGHLSPLRTIMASLPDTGYGRPSVSDDQDGDAVICFARSVTKGTVVSTHLWARRWTRTGKLGTVLHLSPGTRNVTSSSNTVASDFAGNSMAVWAQYSSSGQTLVFGRRISAAGTLGPITYLGAGDSPAVTADDYGDGLAVWQSPGPSTVLNKLYGRKISRAGGFGPKFLLSSDGRFARAASTPWGHFAVIWQQSTASWPVQARFGP